ncbi:MULTISPECIES: Ig-like domain-containing protein [Pseudidiomarina]|uniref:Carboxypeptidase regulatory-like domain-containing protein n=2 Tax=Pseudidiomarina TaxID=2800384 RepID=A0A317Q7Z8_9GAMM|nr:MULTISPECIES: Ig-like domain-containing protein [Pseudidiomarina]PWW10336.1 hypothetical protein DET45_11513 [Pseudidiomarina maritima]RBP87959.1 hypothetical protein DFO81_11749 [Pseudidiomarina tainanensis]
MKKTNQFALSLICISLLTACGGSSSDDVDPPILEEQGPFTLAGSVSGLNGELGVTAADETLTISADGSFEFTSEFDSGDTVAVELSAIPTLQSCSITSASSFTFANADIDDLTIECRDLELYTPIDDSASTSNDTAVTIDVLANDSSELDVALAITSVTEPEHGTAEIVDNKIVYTPDAGFAGTDTFTYTGTDGEAEGTGSVTVTVAQTVAIAGRAIDSPIANATITLTVGEQTFTTTADADGYFSLDLELLDLSSDAVLKITATGAGEQEYVTLNSRLTTVAELLALAGDDRVLSAEESSNVVITHVTTAINQQLEVLAQDAPITAANFNELLMQLDGYLTMEMAALIKLLVDDENYSLPEGFTSIADFLNDADAYNTLLAQADAAGDLQAMIAATAADSELVPAIDPTELAGAYMLFYDYHRYNAHQNYVSYSIDENGALFRQGIYDGESEHVPFVDGKWLGPLQTTARFIPLNSFVNNYGHLYDADLLAKFVASQEGSTTAGSVPLTVSSYLEAMPLSVVGASLTIYESYELELAPIPFEYEGEQLELPAVSPEGSAYTNTYTRAESLIKDLTFDLSEPTEYAYYGEFYAYNNLTFDGLPDDVYYFTRMAYSFYPTSEFSGTFARDVIEGGSYELSPDKTKLTLTYNDPNMNYYAEDLYLLDDQEHAQIVLTKRHLKNGGENWNTNNMPSIDHSLDTANMIADKTIWDGVNGEGKLTPLTARIGGGGYRYSSDGNYYIVDIECDEVAPGGDMWDDCLSASIAPRSLPSGNWEDVDGNSILVGKSCYQDQCGGSFRRFVASYDNGVMALLTSSKFPYGTGPYNIYVEPGKMYFMAGGMTYYKASETGEEPVPVDAASLIEVPTAAYQRSSSWTPDPLRLTKPFAEVTEK